MNTPDAFENSAHQIEALITPEEAARTLGVSVKCLSNWRLRGGGGPKFIKISYNRVRYRPRDLFTWIEARVRTSTSDDGGGR